MACEQKVYAQQIGTFNWTCAYLAPSVYRIELGFLVDIGAAPVLGSSGMRTDLES